MIIKNIYSYRLSINDINLEYYPDVKAYRINYLEKVTWTDSPIKYNILFHNILMSI